MPSFSGVSDGGRGELISEKRRAPEFWIGQMRASLLLILQNRISKKEEEMERGERDGKIYGYGTIFF